ncbi:MAG TPA: PhzF family phenazine biosynthesis protein [Hyphomicrobiales bacterium]|nr:PhzF family phenazine biosynthesis protein [Rhodobiaceae bacterium]HXK53848.1 PhzF family phenazine biosynthesis protein [Hyphomicrobiales bacterium]
MSHRFFTLDVFTDTALAGNPLAVVLDADDLSDARMQAIAGEFNLSETVFLHRPDKKAHSARARIFTPTRELPFAGHPTIGAGVLLAHLKFGDGMEDGGRECDAMFIIEETIGIVRVGVRLTPGKAPFAVFDLPKLPEETGRVPPVGDLAHGIGLVASDIGFDNHKPMRASAGVPFVFVPVKDREALSRCRSNRIFWDTVFRGEDHGAMYIYCRDTDDENHAFRARMFAPAIGLAEDPATGAAAAAFACVVERFEPLGDGVHQLWIEQGQDMGRPSLLSLEVEFAGGALANARIGGNAVILQDGTIRV